MSDVGVTLRAATREDMEVLAGMMQPEDVWRNLEYESPPTPFLLRMLHRRPDWHALIIHRDDDNRPVGFFLLYGVVRADLAVEFDIAIPFPGDRKLGLARKSILAFEKHMLAAPLCNRLWAWIDEDNRPCLELVRTCGWTITRKVERGLEMVDGWVDVVEVRLDVEDWPALLARRG